jgi:hypothetical protein
MRWQAEPDRRERQRPRTGSGTAGHFAIYASYDSGRLILSPLQALRLKTSVAARH